MLYVSRRVCNQLIEAGASKGYDCGVVDSTTGVETVLKLPEIKTVLKEGVSIRGVTCDYDIVDGDFSIVDISPFQEQSTMSRNQVRAMVLYGIQIIVYNAMITDILWSRNTLKSDVKIRLSNFGSICADLLINGLTVGDAAHTVTFIIDDKLKSISDRAFWIAGITGRLGLGLQWCTGLMFDLRELSDDGVARRVYKQLEKFKGPIAPFVIDRQERKLIYCDR